MKIPKIISKNNHEYIFVKQVNDNICLYKDLLYGYHECFFIHELLNVKHKRKRPDRDPNYMKKRESDI